MTITALDARDEYTAVAAQTVFNYTFKIYASSELDVYITPSGQDANDSTDITTAYTVDVATIGNPAGGFITLNSGASAGDLITIVSGMPYNRTVDYQNSGDFLPDTVDGDNDRQVSQIKQVQDLAGRSLFFQNSQQNASGLTLPLPLAQQYLRWKSDLSGIENVVGIPTNPQIVDVRSFGALIDGVTDDQAAIQAAVDSISAGVVYIPAGIALGSSRITIPEGVTVMGDGRGVTTYRLTAQDRAFVLPTGANLIDISVDADGLQAIEGSVVACGSNCLVSNVEVMNGYTGISCGAIPLATGSRFHNILTHDNTSRGIALDPFANGCIVDGVTSYSNGNGGILIGHGSFNNLVSNFVIYDINNAAIWVNQGCYGNKIHSGVIYSPAATTSVGINCTTASYRNTFDNIDIYGYERCLQVVNATVDGVYPSIVNAECNQNVFSRINGYGISTVSTNAYAVTFQQDTGVLTTNDNSIIDCEFDTYYGAFRNISDSANNCNIRGIVNQNIGSGGVMPGMKSTNVVKVSNVEGFEPRIRYSSSNFAIDSTGTKTVVISHGLDYTPAIGSIDARLIRETVVTDFAIDHIWVVAVTATDITARVEIGSASATGGAVASLSVVVDAISEAGFDCSRLT